MKKIKSLIWVAMGTVLFSCCSDDPQPSAGLQTSSESDTFKYKVDQFADIKILRYRVPGFENLSLRQKKLIYYLYQAALSGRDIIWDQNYRHNLCVRRTLEAVSERYQGDRTADEFKKFLIYIKRVWFSNGIHHHYSTDKIPPGFSEEYFAGLIRGSEGAAFPLAEGESLESFIAKLTKILFDSRTDGKRSCQSSDKDMVAASANNFYEGLTQREAENYYADQSDPADTRPVSLGLNSKLVKENGSIVERKWKIGGMYSRAIEKIVFWLEKALTAAENDLQKAAFEKLIEYYRTGDLKTFDDYSVLWLRDSDSVVDGVNGFIEVYSDPLGIKGTWEAVVSFKDVAATRRAETISKHARWFEDHSPADPRFRKKECQGITAKVITVAALGGECYPSTPIGINLPNADWIRKVYGSKSATLENISHAYHQEALGNGFPEEFAYSQEEIKRAEKDGFLGGSLHTDLHECLGHGSGQMLPGVCAEALKNYQSPLEEARADLFALYWLPDRKLIEIGVMPDMNAAHAEYDYYIRNGLMTQLTRIEPGKDIEQAHMRSRQLIAGWVFEKGQPGQVISRKVREGKTFFVINDYEKLRQLFGDLLKEVQRIRSEGDYEAGRLLIETYGVKVDTELHREVMARYEKLKLAPYSGFMNPVFRPVMKDGEIMDVNIEYPEDYAGQMMYYSKEYSFLPTYN